MTSKGRIQRGVRRFMQLLATAFAFVSFGSAWGGEVIYISSSSVAMPSGWNACSLHNSGNPTVFKNLVDSEDNPTGISMFLMSPANGGHARDVGELTGEAAEFEAISDWSSAVEEALVNYLGYDMEQMHCTPVGERQSKRKRSL